MTTKPRIRARLEARRRAILARYRAHVSLADEAAAEHEPELVDAASDAWDARVQSRMADGDAHALAKITDALIRLDDGTYGTCVECDARIERDRLAALPEAPTCIACETARERLAG